MRNTLVLAFLFLLLGAASAPRKALAYAPAAHYAGGAALVIFMFGGLDIFGLQAPKKAEGPALADQIAAGSRNQALALEASELKSLGHDRALGRQIGR